ncbi:MAG: bifunctional demethylmenaquinone methyltransferase/2-methoxy-6-polyprenyl-1,4-benzoquinol methylase UbiE [Burkholderiales bacterium]|jgi:demethylmenaquinone methyltransferase/2-methoxy-6-polyprenyl-1,4-benzoquinol methylase|nr:bifunctional demethylmenaquinone methyltransferase/2-methoxy-6-polyprenyl-1,4-benzoquinol methylase UbiE [Burkholderiales bacterium]
MAKTHFGFQQVDETEKASQVAGVFHSVASKYDLMNDFMSFGLHRIWKAFTIGAANVFAGQRILDIAGGTGDLAFALSKKVGLTGEVWLSDINSSMLTVGRDRLIDQGSLLPCVQLDAENIPFPDSYFDLVTVSFGLRNMTHKEIALKEMCRVTRPGGKTMILEFSKPVQILQPIYDWYSFKVLPWLGKQVAQDAASYQYLAESIRMHPDQEVLKQMLLDVGFDQVEVHRMSGGIVALHMAYKY